MRPEAATHIVAITDDDAEGVKAVAFDVGIKALDPMFDDYVFHAIVASTDNCPNAADEGKEYKKLQQWTGGVFGDLCLRSGAVSLLMGVIFSI